MNSKNEKTIENKINDYLDSDEIEETVCEGREYKQFGSQGFWEALALIWFLAVFIGMWIYMEKKDRKEIAMKDKEKLYYYLKMDEVEIPEGADEKEYYELATKEEILKLYKDGDKIREAKPQPVYFGIRLNQLIATHLESLEDEYGEDIYGSISSYNNHDSVYNQVERNLKSRGYNSIEEFQDVINKVLFSGKEDVDNDFTFTWYYVGNIVSIDRLRDTDEKGRAK